MNFKTIYFSIVFIPLFFNTICAPCSPVQSDSIAALLNKARYLIPENLDEADSLSVSALEKILKIQNDSLSGRAYYQLGVIHYYRGNHLLSSEFYKKGLETKLAGTDDEFASALWNNLGIIYEYENDYEKALEAYLNSLHLAENLGDSLSIFQSYINIGLLYVWLLDYNESDMYLNNALDYFYRTEDDNHIGLCYHNLAILYANSGKSEKVIEAYDQAIEYYGKAENLLELCSVSQDKIDFLLETKNFSDTKQELEKAGRLVKQVSNPYSGGNFYFLRGKYSFYAEKNYTQAEKYFWEALSLLESSNAIKQQLNAYFMLTNLYATTGNTKKHSEVLTRYNELLQQNYNEKTSGNIAQLRTLYEVNKKEKQILELSNQKQREALLRANLVIALIGSVVIGMVLFFFNRRKVYLTRQRALILENENQHRKEQAEKYRLEKQLREKEAERYRLDLEKKEQELVFQTLKQANTEQLNHSVNLRLRPFADRFSRKKDREEFSGALQEITREVSRNPLADFEHMFIQMHGGFYEKLLDTCPGLSRSELQMCALLRMNLPSKEISNLLNLAVSTIDQRRHSIRKKLGLNSQENLVSYLICI